MSPRLGLVSDLWRFPVKSFGGERLRRSFVGPIGVLGDRRHAVVDEDGAALSARRNSALLGFHAEHDGGDADAHLRISDPAGQVYAPDDPALSEILAAELGRPAAMARSAGAVHDAAALHLVTTASLAAIAEWVGDPELDRRRFRANVVVEAANSEAFVESTWVGRRLQLGPEGPVIEIVSPTERCAVTTFDPDTLERNSEVLANIANRRENFFGVYAEVLSPGWVSVGEPVLSAPGS